MPENYPQDNTCDIGPIEGDFNFVLRRTDRKMWPWRQGFYDVEPAVARDVTHADGVRAPTFFVVGWVHRMVLYRLGWKDVTASWKEAVKFQWKHGDNAEGEDWWKRNDEPEVESEIPALNDPETEPEPEETPLLDPDADADAIANATITDLDGNEVTPNEDGTAIAGTPVDDDFDPGDDFDDDDDGDDDDLGPDDPFDGDEELRAMSTDEVGAEIIDDGDTDGDGDTDDDANDWPKTWADIEALDYSGDTSLQTHLKAFDLKASGTKGDLRIRLAEHLKITIPE